MNTRKVMKLNEKIRDRVASSEIRLDSCTKVAEFAIQKKRFENRFYMHCMIIQKVDILNW